MMLMNMTAHDTSLFLYLSVFSFMSSITLLSFVSWIDNMGLPLRSNVVGIEVDGGIAVPTKIRAMFLLSLALGVWKH